MTKIIKLQDYKDKYIQDKTLEKLKLLAYDFTDIERADAWTKKISGSKIKDVSTRPLTTIAYLLGMITEEQWSHQIDVIPKMNLYREHGLIMEDIIVDRVNKCIKHEGLDNPDLIKFEDYLTDFTSVPRIRNLFVPSLNDKVYIQSEKRSLVKTGSKYIDLFMLNIDGYTENPDGSIKHIVEVKTKTGALGNDLDYAGYMKLHLDQITYYTKMLEASDGAILLVDHHSRGLKVHTFTMREINNNWKELSNKIKVVGMAVAGNRYKEPLENVVNAIESIDWGEKDQELITKEQLIAAIKSTYGVGV